MLATPYFSAYAPGPFSKIAKDCSLDYEKLPNRSGEGAEAEKTTVMQEAEAAFASIAQVLAFGH
jgi:hypothetical protein